jgi:hypothetical protein
MKKYTTRILYSKTNSCNNEYAYQNCNPYGTKWRVRCYWDYDSYCVVSAICIDPNWTIDEKKINGENFC